MQARYTHMWTSALSTDELQVLAMEEWAECLAGVTGEQIAHGFEVLTSEYPPSPEKFRQCCVGVNEGLGHNTLAYRNNFTENRLNPKLLEKKADKETARKALDEIRGIIRD